MVQKRFKATKKQFSFQHSFGRPLSTAGAQPLTGTLTPAFHHQAPSTLKSEWSVGFGMRLDKKELDDGKGGVCVGQVVRQGEQADNPTI